LQAAKNFLCVLRERTHPACQGRTLKVPPCGTLPGTTSASLRGGGALTGLLTGILLGGSTDDAADATGLVVGASLGLLLGATTSLGIAEYYNVQEITLLVK